MGKPPTTKPAGSPTTEVSEEESLAQVIDRQIGDLVSQKQREVIVAKMTTLMVSEHFSGPLPHPKHLVGYEQISPGAADRIITMAEKQQDHHIEMDKKVVDAEVNDRKLGMLLGAGVFVFLIACALASTFLTKSDVVPGLFLGSGLVLAS